MPKFAKLKSGFMIAFALDVPMLPFNFISESGAFVNCITVCFINNPTREPSSDY
jgi:cytosine/uracil/thiamine/allantoin permease